MVGAGLIGLEKVESLLRCGASIRVVAPDAVARVQQLSSQGEIEWLPRRYEPEDVNGCDLIIAATSDREVNRAVFEEASTPLDPVQHGGRSSPVRLFLCFDRAAGRAADCYLDRRPESGAGAAAAA